MHALIMLREHGVCHINQGVGRRPRAAVTFCDPFVHQLTGCIIEQAMERNERVQATATINTFHERKRIFGIAW